MPDSLVKTVKDQIFFQYSKIIIKAAFNCIDGVEAKKKYYGMIKNKFKELQTGSIKWSDITREDKQFIQSDKCCIYCGSVEDLTWEHIVPRSLSIKPECANCPIIQGISNQVWACRSCNSSKSNMGLYKFYKKLLSDDPKFFDKLPSLLEKKYLKTIFNCHICNGSLDSQLSDISVLDLDLS